MRAEILYHPRVGCAYELTRMITYIYFDDRKNGGGSFGRDTRTEGDGGYMRGDDGRHDGREQFIRMKGIPFSAREPEIIEFYQRAR